MGLFGPSFNDAYSVLTPEALLRKFSNRNYKILDSDFVLGTDVGKIRSYINKLNSSDSSLAWSQAQTKYKIDHAETPELAQRLRDIAYPYKEEDLALALQTMGTGLALFGGAPAWAVPLISRATDRDKIKEAAYGVNLAADGNWSPLKGVVKNTAIDMGTAYLGGKAGDLFAKYAPKVLPMIGEEFYTMLRPRTGANEWNKFMDYVGFLGSHGDDVSKFATTYVDDAARWANNKWFNGARKFVNYADDTADFVKKASDYVDNAKKLTDATGIDLEEAARYYGMDQSTIDNISNGYSILGDATDYYKLGRSPKLLGKTTGKNMVKQPANLLKYDVAGEMKALDEGFQNSLNQMQNYFYMHPSPLMSSVPKPKNPTQETAKLQRTLADTRNSALPKLSPYAKLWLALTTPPKPKPTRPTQSTRAVAQAKPSQGLFATVSSAASSMLGGMRSLFG